jgi:hypothetical protein
VAKRGAKSAVPTPPEPSQNVVFEYIKSPLFRVIHADGAIGGVTPTGSIHFALYSERGAIPRQTVHPRNPDGTLGDAIPSQTIQRPGVIREMDVDVVMNVGFVPVFITWLQKVQQQAEEQIQAAMKAKAKSDDK